MFYLCMKKSGTFFPSVYFRLFTGMRLSITNKQVS